MSWTESELRTPSLEERLEEILEEEDFSDFTEAQRHKMLDRLDVFGAEDVRELIQEWREGR